MIKKWSKNDQKMMSFLNIKKWSKNDIFMGSKIDPPRIENRSLFISIPDAFGMTKTTKKSSTFASIFYWRISHWLLPPPFDQNWPVTGPGTGTGKLIRLGMDLIILDPPFFDQKVIKNWSFFWSKKWWSKNSSFLNILII